MITDDGRGVARGLENQLLAAGVPVERIGGPEAPVDWTSPAAIESVVDRLRSRGPLAGIVHALPWDSGPRSTGSRPTGRPGSASK